MIRQKKRKGSCSDNATDPKKNPVLNSFFCDFRKKIKYEQTLEKLLCKQCPKS